jgi:hypothetical protein
MDKTAPSDHAWDTGGIKKKGGNTVNKVPTKPKQKPTPAAIAALQQAIATRQAIDGCVKHIAEQLGETSVEPLAQLHKIVSKLGPEQSLAFLQEAQELESGDGLLIKSGKRRRTLGGVFFRIVRERGPDNIWRCFDAWPKPPKKQTQKSPEGKATKKPPVKHRDKEEQQVTFMWRDRIKCLDQIGLRKGETKAVRIAISGRPGTVIRRPGCVVTTMKQRTPPDLPAGLPERPAFFTSYVLFIAKKQWDMVAAALEADPDDMLIVEGWPTLDPETSSIAIFAQAVTTKRIRQAKRQQQEVTTAR